MQIRTLVSVLNPLLGRGGVCRAVAAHQKSAYPIDAIWSSHETSVVQARSYVPGDGDHSIAEAVFQSLEKYLCLSTKMADGFA